MMRVTNILRRDQAIGEIQGHLGRLHELQRQVATGKRFSRLEQDPIAAAQVLRVERGTRAIDQYTKNGIAAQVRLGAEEAVIRQSDELLRQARDFALSFAKGDPPYTPDQTTQRQIAAERLDGLVRELVSLGNTRIGNEYILGGEQSTTPPFDTTPGATFGDYQGGVHNRQTEVAEGVFVDVNHTGDQYLGPAIAAVKALRDAVDPANLQTEAQVATEIQNVFDRSQGLLVSLARTGATGARLASTIENNAVLKNDLLDVRESVESISTEEAVAKLLSLQTTVEASYAATGRLLSLTITDYLR